jgi:hypothetical protein
LLSKVSNLSKLDYLWYNKCMELDTNTDIRFILSPECGSAKKIEKELPLINSCREECNQFMAENPEKQLRLLGAVASCNGPNYDGSCGLKIDYPAVEEIL